MRRRRMLGLIAAPAALIWPSGPAEPLPAVRWRGSALGARASLTIHHADPARARTLITQVLREVERLERVFSLHRADAALSALNRAGRLRAPPQELLELLALAGRVHEVSAGAFDPTVQPLWRLWARHFAEPDAPSEGPTAARIEDVLERTGFTQVEIEPGEIRFGRAGMALTLNGIAQGYITDRAADLLRDAGLEHVLVDLGELAALGAHPDGRPWRLAHGAASPLGLMDAAVATSSPSGTAFDRARTHHHLIDPSTGRSSAHARTVTVLAPSAALADALSTAIAIMPPAGARALARRFGDRVRVIDDPDTG